MNLSILVRLGSLLGVAILAILLTGAIGVYGSQHLKGLGEKLHQESFSELALASELSTSFQGARALLAKAPSQLDIDQLKVEQNDFLTMVSDLEKKVRGYVKSMPEGDPKDQFNALAEGLSGYAQSAQKVYDAAAAFAQEQALEIMNGPIAEVESNVEISLLIIGSTAQSHASESVAEMQSGAQTTLVAVVAVSVLLVITMVLAGWLAGARGIVSPIRRLTDAMNRLADREMDTEVPDKERHDEIGAMSQALQVFKDSMIANDEMVERERQEQEERTRRAQTIEAATQKFDTGVASVLSSLEEASASVNSVSQRMSDVSDQTKSRATVVATASHQAANNVQTVASAAEELSASIDEISHQVTRSSEITASAVSEAEGANTQVQGLAEAAQKIGEVVSLISDIADQTNLLALNATIEAARAGDAGKGFAVVASEVKNLANQTAKATEDISNQVNGIQTATQQAVAAIQGITNTIGQVNEISSSIASAVEEQGAATSEIARNVQEASSGTQEVTESIGQVTDAANDAAETSSQALTASETLTQQTEGLKQQVNAFLAEVRVG